MNEHWLFLSPKSLKNSEKKEEF
ncbi:hypothetical protein Godav_022251 [Gossypium davidsonii]|uniref:Uncharacterized protein n=1 Tax=Gossypium davidsonii TaxID=34287 RepID=A0A7J8T7S8_GOSDV|nr:hypothetical protein [Gossypium davidsonii]